MSKQTDALKALLHSQLEHAVVEHIGTEADDYPSYDVGTYSVFVPGAIRELNIVSANDEAEAIEKVRVCLEKKIDTRPDISEAPSVEVSPDNLKQSFKAKTNVQGEN